jgi:PAS domain S-box-containing protein
MSQRRVLIVEDEMVVQLHLARIVGELGHQVVGTAMTTREASEIAAREAPELVLMDIHLADGDDGIETAEKLVRGLDCAVVFITAYADEATLARSERVGAAGYLVKPFTAPAVRAAISTALAGHARLLRARHDARTLSSILGNIGDALFTLDEADSITFMNPRAAELTGCPPTEAGERTFLDVVHLPVDSERRHVQEALAQARSARSKVSHSRLSIRDRAGAERTVDVEIEPYREGKDGADEAAGTGGLIVNLRDRSPRVPRAALPTRAHRQPFGEGTRILVYSHDTFGLGHLRRCLALIRTLCARHPGVSALLVTGSPMVHRFPMPDGADYVKLPAIRKVESEQYEARTLHVSSSEIRSMRSNLILHTLRDFDPNVLLVDHSPTGSKGELLPALEWLADRGGCTRILGLRDIIDEPSAVVSLWKATGVYEVLNSQYDHLVVYGNQGVYDPVAQYQFPDAVASKTRFVNYVCDRSAPARDEDQDAEDDGRPIVAVSIGGGDGGGETLIQPFLEMMRRFRSQLDFRAEILTGPFLASEVEGRLRALAQGLPVNLRSFIPSTAALFRRAELVVATAGYNTTADVLGFARRAVLVPRVLYRQEQLIRARRFEELGLVTCLHPDQATPELLLAAIQRARRDEPLTRARAEGRVFLDGAERFAQFCGALSVDVRARR